MLSCKKDDEIQKTSAPTISSSNIGVSSLKCYGGSDDETVVGIKATADGGYFVVANTWSPDGIVSNPSGGIDILVIKFNSSNAIVWTKVIGGNEDDQAYDFCVNSSNEIFIAINSYSSNNGFTSSAFTASGYVIKLNAVGNREWITKTVYPAAIGIVLSKDENVFALAQPSNLNDFRIIKVNKSNGAVIWDKATSINQEPADILVLSDSSIVVTCDDPNLNGIAVEHLTKAGISLSLTSFNNAIFNLNHTELLTNNNLLITGKTVLDDRARIGVVDVNGTAIVDKDISSLGGPVSDNDFLNSKHSISITSNSNLISCYQLFLSASMVGFDTRSWGVIVDANTGNANSTLKYVIDGNGDDEIIGVAKLINGKIIVAGNTDSNNADFIGNFNSGNTASFINTDIFIAELN